MKKTKVNINGQNNNQHKLKLMMKKLQEKLLYEFYYFLSTICVITMVVSLFERQIFNIHYMGIFKELFIPSLVVFILLQFIYNTKKINKKSE